MHIFVGSINPVKINAVIVASSEKWPDVMVQGFEVSSGVSEQPRSDLQTQKGAINRAKAAFLAGLEKHESKNYTFNNKEVIGIGLEGGVFEDSDGVMWSTVWVAVIDTTGFVELANGARFRLAEIVAQQIRKGGEMGPVVSELVGDSDVKTKQGMIGIVTKGFVDRTQEYASIAKLAIGLWYGKGWIKEL